jgi:ankyrin repeat protein
LRTGIIQIIRALVVRRPLFIAAVKGHEAVVKLLLEKGADLSARGEEDWTPLCGPATNAHEVVVKLLLDKEPRTLTLTLRTIWVTPLMMAAESRHEAIVKLLLEKGVGSNSKDKWGQAIIIG